MATQIQNISQVSSRREGFYSNMGDNLTNADPFAERPTEPLFYKRLRGTVMDIGGSTLSKSLRPLLEQKLLWKGGDQLKKSDGSTQRLLPSALLSNDAGLKIWKEITRLPDYYQTRDEVDLLVEKGNELAKYIPSGATLIDLGSGDVRKIKPLLSILNAQKKTIYYFALDLSRTSLEASMNELNNTCRYEYIHCFGLWGSFNGDLSWLQDVPSPRFFCSLGSIFGNDWFMPAIDNLNRWRKLMSPSDYMILGMDSCKDQDTLWRSYHDRKGLFERFIRNGLEHANLVLGFEWYKAEDWEVTGRFHEHPCMHQFVITAIRDVACGMYGTMAKGTQLDCYEAFKYEPFEMKWQFAKSGFELKHLQRSSSCRIYQYVLAPHNTIPSL